MGALFIWDKAEQIIRPQNSAPKSGPHPRIRSQIRVPEVQDPLFENLPLTFVCQAAAVADAAVMCCHCLQVWILLVVTAHQMRAEARDDDTYRENLKGGSQRGA